jgi:hypothetical protein
MCRAAPATSRSVGTPSRSEAARLIWEEQKRRRDRQRTLPARRDAVLAAMIESLGQE